MAVKASERVKRYQNPNGPTISTVERKVIEQGGTAGCICILSQQSEGQDFFVQTCSYFLTHTHQKEIGG